MVLLAVIEQPFGTALPVEQAKSNATFEYLANALGLAVPQRMEHVQFKSLKVRKIASSRGPSRGVAMTMPGFSGTSHVFPFHRAEFFKDFDLWAVEHPLTEGRMLHQGRWWTALQDLVEGISLGVLPAPQVVVGFSFAGSFAWLANPLVTSAACAPRWAVLVDAVPLASIVKGQHSELERALGDLQKSAESNSVKTLHLRRSFLEELSQTMRSAALPVDRTAFLPTLYHLDTLRWEMLETAKEVVWEFLDDRTPTADVKSAPDSLLGGLLFSAFRGDEGALKRLTTTEVYKEHPARYDQWVDLAVLHAVANEQARFHHLCAEMLRLWPKSVLSHLVKQRARRGPAWLFFTPQEAPLPRFAAALERKLTLLRPRPPRVHSLGMRALALYLDVCVAVWNAFLFRLPRRGEQ